MKLITVQGCSIKIEPEKGVLACVPSLSVASSDVSVEGHMAYKDKMTVTLSSLVLTLASPPSIGVANISAPVPVVTIDIVGTSGKATTDNYAFVLEGDEGSADVTFTFPPVSVPEAATKTVKIKVTVNDPGQNVLNVT